MHDVEVGAADGLVVDLAALVAAVRATDGGDVHAFLDEMSVEDRVPCGRCCLHEIAAFNDSARGIGAFDCAPELPGPMRAESPAVFLVRAVDLDLVKGKLAAKEFDMGGGLPSAAEKSEDFGLRRGQILRADDAQRGDADLLNYAIGHDCDGLDALDVKEDHESTVAIARGHRENAAAFDSVGEGKSRH